jgi:hypothetical protein
MSQVFAAELCARFTRPAPVRGKRRGTPGQHQPVDSGRRQTGGRRRAIPRQHRPDGPAGRRFAADSAADLRQAAAAGRGHRGFRATERAPPSARRSGSSTSCRGCRRLVGAGRHKVRSFYSSSCRSSTSSQQSRRIFSNNPGPDGLAGVYGHHGRPSVFMVEKVMAPLGPDDGKTGPSQHLHQIGPGYPWPAAHAATVMR